MEPHPSMEPPDSNNRATIEQPKWSHHYSRLVVTFSQDGASPVSLITVADGVTGHGGGLLDDPIGGAVEILKVLVGAIKELLDVPINATAELLDVPVDAAVPHVVVDVDGAGRGGGLAGRGAQLLAAQEGSQAGAGAGEREREGEREGCATFVFYCQN